MGATVLHEDAIFPVRKEGIPINIRNTNAPEDKGTLIVESTMSESHDLSLPVLQERRISLLSTVEKAMMNS